MFLYEQTKSGFIHASTSVLTAEGAACGGVDLVSRVLLSTSAGGIRGLFNGVYMLSAAVSLPVSTRLKLVRGGTTQCKHDQGMDSDANISSTSARPSDARHDKPIHDAPPMLSPHTRSPANLPMAPYFQLKRASAVIDNK